MIIVDTKDFQTKIKKLAEAIDTNTFSVDAELLQLSVENTDFVISISNGEYFAKLKIPQTTLTEQQFCAAVNASLFLSLILKITTKNIEFSIEDKALIVKGNGTYKLPLVDKVLNLQNLAIKNVTAEFTFMNDTLMSIYNINSKEIQSAIISNPIQKIYYLDEQGCITFTTGACVNSFVLPTPIKLLIPGKVVKLFKLFEDMSDIKAEVGYDLTPAGKVQAKLSLTSDNIGITALLPTENDFNTTVPVKVIRDLANKNFDFCLTVNKDEFLAALNRLSIFSKTTAKINKQTILEGCLEFKDSQLTIYDGTKVNNETLTDYSIIHALSELPFTAKFNLIDIQKVLSSCTESFINLNFGDPRCLVISRGLIKNIVRLLN